jgi:hypothetical protein
MEIKFELESVRSYIYTLFQLHIDYAHRVSNEAPKLVKSSDVVVSTKIEDTAVPSCDHAAVTIDSNSVLAGASSGDCATREQPTTAITDTHSSPNACLQARNPRAPLDAHVLSMRCTCSHRQGMCTVPLDGTYSHSFDCRWVCCDKLWSEQCCSLTVEEVAERLKQPPDVLLFVGNKNGHVSTARQLRYFVCERGELKYYTAKLNVAPYGKDLKGSVKLKGYKVITETDTNRIYLQPSVKGTKDLDIEIDDHLSVRDFVAGEIRRHVELADVLFSNEEASSPARQSSVEHNSSPLFKPRPGRAVSNHNLAKSAGPSPTLEVTAPDTTPSSLVPSKSPCGAESPVHADDVAGDINSPPVETSIDINAPPSPLKFEAQKKGHVNVGMKSRYFVVHGGTLSYYVSSSDTPPYGKDLKGSIYLANYEIIDCSTSPASRPNDLRIYIQNKVDNSKDMDLQFADKALRDEIQEGLEKHIKYATACRKFDVDVEQTREFLSSTDAVSPVSVSVPQPASAAASSAPIKRSSTLSLFMGSTASNVTATFPKSYALTAEDRSKWSLFVPAGENIVATASVNKPNPVGKALMRQIVLTSGSKLLYIDPADNSVKGTIDVAAGRSLWPIAKSVKRLIS